MEKFKVGDWIKSTKFTHMKPSQVQSIYKSNTRKGDFGLKCGGTVNYSSEVELWQPKEGEWCWYNKKYFIKVKNIKDEQIYFSSLDGMYINDWDYLCKFEPFIGELPTFLKDNKWQN